MSAFMHSWGEICDNRGSIGAKLSLIWAVLVPTSPILGSTWVYLRQSCHPLGPSWGQIDASLAQLGANLELTWCELEPTWVNLG